MINYGCSVFTTTIAEEVENYYGVKIDPSSIAEAYDTEGAFVDLLLTAQVGTDELLTGSGLVGRYDADASTFTLYTFDVEYMELVPTR